MKTIGSGTLLGVATVIGAACGLALNAKPQAAPADPPGTVIEETWEAAHVEGTRIGFLHTTVRSLEAEGGKRIRASAELDLTFKRHNALLHLRMEQGTEETRRGTVLAVFMRQFHEGGRQLVLTGAVEDGRLHVRVDDGRIERRIRWSEEVVGLYRLEHLFQQRKVKAGDRFTLLRYEPTLNTVVTVRVAVKEPEEVKPIPGTAGAGAGKNKLLRVDMTADKIEVPGASVQPPPVVWWLDDKLLPVRRQIELDGLGAVVLTRTTREAAKAPAAPGRLADIGLKTLIPLNRTLPRPYASRTAVYRIRLRGDSDPGSALARDDHQDVRNLQGDTFELHVHPPRQGASPLTPNPSPPGGGRGGQNVSPLPPGGGEGSGVRGGSAFLSPCHFINCDDPRVKELARRTVGDEKDPWMKARRLERWVKQSMRPDNAVPLAPAGDVARQLRGDCRQYALLTAALCRAAGIPARTAVGLLYVEKNRRPLMGFHMWTEVCIDGRWLGLDGTLGQGGVSAAHIKIADHSWHDTQSLTPLLPANRVLGKINITVLNSETEE